ncbi:methylated-DNA--protein-cysteine methyltransferase [Bordetella pertussis]|nr:methylated-DNA--protein-cysteine methyltransferase [Bordetella pertussis]
MQPEGTPFQRQVWQALLELPFGHDTSLTGFGGGLPRKQALLAHEGHRYLSRAARARRVSTTQMELPLGAA